MSSWIVTVEEDPKTGNIILPIPKELIELKGWKEGDDLDFQQLEDGSWTLVKV
jgi:bifunctional DNA-binding transcriptional regulator/antitoxin component of YhaV-PrlF toxin-antitoxin module